MPDLAPVVLGPVVLGGDRALAFMVLAVFVVAAEVAARRRGGDADWAWRALVAGVVAARLGFVVVNAEVYLARPLEALFFWQGGFLAPVGVVAAMAWTVWESWRRGTSPRILVAPVVASVMALVVGLLILPVAPARPSLAASEASFARLDGSVVSAEAWLGSPSVVNLWATWCGPCRRELPMLIEEVGGRDDVRLVLASQREAAGTVATYLEARDLPGDAVVLDAQGALQRAVGAVGLPTTLFVDASGAVLDVAFGELSRARVRRGISLVRGDSRSVLQGLD